MARVLQVCNSNFYLSKFLAPLVIELANQGHAVECLCEGPFQHSQFDALEVQVHDFPFPKRGSITAFLSAIHAMRKVLREGQFDCVNSHNRNASIVARVAAWLENVPVNLYTAHGFYFHDDQSVIARELTILLESALAKITDFTLSQSREDVDFAVSRGFISKDRIAHIGNGIEASRFGTVRDRDGLEAQLKLGPSAFRVATTGRIVRGKGFEDLLAAFGSIRHSIPGSQLVMIGGNIAQDIEPFQQEFLRRVQDLELQSSVVVTGMVPNVEDYLGAADAFVLPSYREGVPRSLIEAMMSGLPCIATNIRGCKEVIADGEDGFLYPAGDIGALAQKLRQLAEDRSLRGRFSGAARTKAMQNFDERAYVRKQVQMIGMLTSSQEAAAQ